MAAHEWNGQVKTGAKSLALRGAALIAIMALAGCAGRGPEPIDPEKSTAAQIFQRGEYELSKGRPKKAAGYFSEIERLYPYSEWAARSSIMEAYSWHRKGDYENARAAARRYLEFFPAGEDAAYAQYLLALSYYDQIDEIGRDPAVTYAALQELRKVIERYPDSEYAQPAVLKFDLAFDHLASKEMEVGRYYLRRGNYAAAINRFRKVVENFQTTQYTPEALYRLVESFLALGLEDEAQTAAAILGHNFSASPFYRDAHDLLKGRKLRPEARSGGWLGEIYQQAIRGEWI